MINEVRRAQAGLCGDCAGMTAENVRGSRSAGCWKLSLLDSGRAVWGQCRDERKYNNKYNKYNKYNKHNE